MLSGTTGRAARVQRWCVLVNGEEERNYNKCLLMGCVILVLAALVKLRLEKIEKMPFLLLQNELYFLIGV